VDFKYLIHKIHRGEELTRDFTVYGFGNRPFNYNEVRYPGDLRNCQKCHQAGTYQLPLPQGLLPTQAPRDYYSPLRPESAACLSCHDTAYAAAHAYVNTAPFAEACAACHGNNSEFSVDKVHAR
jgi:OmcA/MtrC family decaheme c-type cytochrome